MDFVATVEEHNSLSFFHSLAGFNIAGVLDTAFWTNLIPQLSHEDEAVRYALMALSSIYRERSLINQDIPSIKQLHSSKQQSAFALDNYNKAISATMLRMSQDTDNSLSALVTCILFCCIESLQGHFNESLRFASQGIRLLSETQESNVQHQSNPLIATDVAPIFSRLAVQSSMFFGPPSPEETFILLSSQPILQPSSTFDSLAQARSELINLASHVHTLYSACTFAKIAENIEPSSKPLLVETQKSILSALKSWHQSFLALTTNLNHENPPISIAIHTLNMQYQVSTVWTNCIISRSQRSFDSFIDSFRAIIQSATAIHSNQTLSSPHKHPGFTFEMGIISPLYWTGLKCRHPILRRQALALLNQCQPIQEGLWHAGVSARAVARVIEIEERTTFNPPGIDEHNDDATNWPDEHSRLQEVNVMTGDLRRTESGVEDDDNVFAIGKSQIMMHSLPDGLDGPWKVDIETI